MGVQVGTSADAAECGGATSVVREAATDTEKAKGENNTNPNPNPAAFDPSVDPEGLRCSLRGLVWKVLLGTIHTDAVLYIRLVGRGPSSEDVKIREDTFRTFAGDEVFRRRVPEDKLSRINNAFVNLNSPPPTNEETAAAAAAVAAAVGGGAAGAGAGSGGDGHASLREGRGGSGSAKTASSDGEGWDEPERAGEAGAGAGECVDAPVGGGGGGGGSRGAVVGVPRQGKGKYVQGMTVLCAPLLFVMPEVDAFYCFNRLLNEHMPR